MAGFADWLKRNSASLESAVTASGGGPFILPAAEPPTSVFQQHTPSWITNAPIGTRMMPPGVALAPTEINNLPAPVGPGLAEAMATAAAPPQQQAPPRKSGLGRGTVAPEVNLLGDMVAAHVARRAGVAPEVSPQVVDASPGLFASILAALPDGGTPAAKDSARVKANRDPVPALTATPNGFEAPPLAGMSIAQLAQFAPLLRPMPVHEQASHELLGVARFNKDQSLKAAKNDAERQSAIERYASILGQLSTPGYNQMNALTAEQMRRQMGIGGMVP